MLVISAVGYTRKGERAGILLPFDLTPQSLHLNYISKDKYDIAAQIFSPKEFELPGKKDGNGSFTPFNLSVFLNGLAPEALSEEPFTGSIKDAIHRENLDKIEDHLKSEFAGIVPHNRDGRHVTEDNLLKTQYYLGAEAAAACERCNLSTAWRLPGSASGGKKDFWDEIFESQLNYRRKLQDRLNRDYLDGKRMEHYRMMSEINNNRMV